jgi:hypothetical protein
MWIIANNHLVPKGFSSQPGSEKIIFSFFSFLLISSEKILDHEWEYTWYITVNMGERTFHCLLS